MAGSGASVGGASAVPPWPAGSAVLDIVIATTGRDLTFAPERIVVAGGSAVRLTFENLSSEPHNLVFLAGVTGSTRSIVAPGTSDVVAFIAPGAGLLPFGCTIHEGMDGVVTVGPHGRPR
jgi:plastocyanin